MVCALGLAGATNNSRQMPMQHSGPGSYENPAYGAAPFQQQQQQQQPNPGGYMDIAANRNPNEEDC